MQLHVVSQQIFLAYYGYFTLMFLLHVFNKSSESYALENVKQFFNLQRS